MNKTININLGGFFFHIDESAYKKLNRYLDSISRSLSDDPQGKNEIISDIEARISELLSERITDARQVVNESDIDEIITIMGQPEDYAEAEEGYADSSYKYQKRNTTGKKLYRDGDDKFLGGVASGIAHYLEIDPIWVRLILIAMFFGAGFGFLIYIILWILLPEAKTTAEKLQMEGEPVNIDNIEKKIRKEFQEMSDKIKTTAEGVSEKIKNGADEISDKFSNKNRRNRSKGNSGLQDFLNALGNIILAFFKVIGKFIGVILIFVAAVTLIALIISLFSVGSVEFLNIDSEYVQYPPFFYDSTLPRWLLATFLFILVGIPFLILFVLGLRILSSNVKQFSKTTSLTLLGIWLVALLGIVFTGIEFGTSKAYDGVKVEKSTLNFVANDTIRLKVVNDDDIYYQSNLRRNDNSIEVEVNNEMKTYSNYVKFDVEKSDSDESYMQIRKESRGKSRSRANKNASEIEYKFNVEGNKILIDGYFLSDYKNIWKDEEINITLYIPEYVTVFFESSTKKFFYDLTDVDDRYYSDIINHHFLMTQKGLECSDCNDETEDENN